MTNTKVQRLGVVDHLEGYYSRPVIMIDGGVCLLVVKKDRDFADALSRGYERGELEAGSDLKYRWARSQISVWGRTRLARVGVTANRPTR